MRIVKTVNEYGSQTIGTSQLTLDTKTIKGLGDIVNWTIRTDLTTTDTGATELADGGTPSGSFKGATIARFFNSVKLTDNNNTDLFVANKDDLWRFAWLFSLIDTNDFIFKRALSWEPTTITGAQTKQVDFITFAQSIGVADLPATIEINLGVLSDFYSTVGSGTAVINQLSVIVRYVPPSAAAITLRCKAYNVSAFSADTDISSTLPDGIKIHLLAYMPGNPNASSAPSEMVNTRVDRIFFRRGSNEEIENQRRDYLDDYVDDRFGNRPSGMTLIPDDAFRKTDASFWHFDINAQIAPRVFYIYQ